MNRAFRRFQNRLLEKMPALASAFLAAGLIGTSPAPLAVEQDGAAPNAASLLAVINQLNNNGANAAGNANFQTSAGASITITSFGGLTQRLTNGGAVTVTYDSAYNIVNQLPGAFLGMQFTYDFVTNAATTVATPTLTSTDVTLAGTTTVLAAALRRYALQITQLTTTVGMSTTAGTTFSSLAQVGSTNNFTVTLGTNAIVPTVGTLINLTGITGTLPPGWYPIVKVTSATSFIIATPAGTVWTATAATVGTGTVAPATYAPLVTITGAWATVTATTSV